MLRTSTRTLAALTAGLLALVLCATARAQAVAGDSNAAPASAPAAGAAADTAGKTPADLWKETLYYIRFVRPDLALSYAQALLESKVTPEQMFQFSRETANSIAELERAARNKDLKPAVEQIMRLIQQGYVVKRSDPEIIAEAVGRLTTGTLQGYEAASARLKESGEYALPQLMAKLADAKVPDSQKQRILAFLPTLGLPAVRPLSEALESQDQLLVERVASVLGQLGYPHSAPMLRAVLDRKDLAEQTRTAVVRALNAVAGEVRNKGLGELYMDLAGKYYYRGESVQSEPQLDTGNVWYWKENLGLTYKAVPRAIFCDVYAMRCAREALKADPDNGKAVSLWLAADLKRQANLPQGATDPTQAEGAASATSFALGAGAKYLQDVLARGLADHDLPVILGAIEALGQTAGAPNLVKATAGGQQALVEAMGYPDGRVRFLAAATLASARPQEAFAGSDMVIPALNEALRMSSRKRAILFSPDQAMRNRVKGLARASGWDVIDDVKPDQAGAAAKATGGADLLIVAQADAPALLGSLRREALFARLPAIVLAPDAADVRQLAERDKKVTLLDVAANDDLIKNALASAGAAGNLQAMSTQEAADWAIRAAQVVRQLGLTRNSVLEYAATVPALVELTKDKRPEVALAAASALAVIESPAAQQAIVSQALAAGDEKLRVAAFGFASESARVFGRLLTEAQAQAVLDVVNSPSSPALHEAASQLLGTLDLPSDKIKDLILKADMAK